MNKILDDVVNNANDRVKVAYHEVEGMISLATDDGYTGSHACIVLDRKSASRVIAALIIAVNLLPDNA